MYSPKKEITNFAGIFLLVIITTAVPLASPAHSQQLGLEDSNSSNNDNANANTLNIQDIPAKKVHVGDIDIAYKTFGKGDPIILINGFSFAMDSWDTTLMETLASNHTVIVFDNRGIGNTTSGIGQQFSVGLFANDTAGLLDALNITKADVLGWSLGGAIAQELVLNNPDKVGRLVLYAIGCGGADSLPPSQEFLSVLTNGTGNSEERIARVVPLFFPEEWRNENPNYLDNIPKTTETVLNETLGRQLESALNWQGTCDRLKNMTQPTLVIVGNEDTATPAPNNLRMAELIPGAWYVQINGGGHALMYQYPEQFSGLVKTFLENTNTP